MFSRLEAVPGPPGVTVLVDYAHKPDALEAVLRARDAERLAQAAGTGAQQPDVLHPAPAAHPCKPGRGLDRPDQHRARAAFGFAHEVDAPMDAVGAVHIGEAGRAEHDGIALGLPAEAVRGRVGVVIGLDLDDAPADAVEAEPGADQVGRDGVNAARKEIPADHGHRCRHGYFLRSRGGHGAAAGSGLWLCGNIFTTFEDGLPPDEARRYSATRLTEFEAAQGGAGLSLILYDPLSPVAGVGRVRWMPRPN